MIVFIIIFFSLLCGFISHDILGVFALSFGLLNACYSGYGKISNYIYGGIFCLISGYIYFINGLFGTAFLSLFLYFPLQVYGYINWNKNKDNNEEVLVRRFTFKKSFFVTSMCILSSLIFGVILSMIPNQQLAFLDSFSNCINICATILMSYRYRECFYVWLFNNVFDLAIWIINFINGSSNSFMMLTVSIGYLAFNIVGIVIWYKKIKDSDYIK